MSKITFRADEDLIKRIEGFDASKSEIMRDALRAYLDDHASSAADPEPAEESLDALVAERVDALIADRMSGAFTPRQPQDVNVNITLDGSSADLSDDHAASVNSRADASHAPSNDASHDPDGSKTSAEMDENDDEAERKTCTQCGENLSQSHVYCPNCGEKSARRVFCECGDEIRSDWSFCPGCGRRTPAADVLD
jgi:predicted RNA-binding Zn-ribbon protein involved in translation (DUF1610 family)/Arc/MetJ-type ribon-helix-helix transcriptional regulator